MHTSDRCSNVFCCCSYHHKKKRFEKGAAGEGAEGEGAEGEGAKEGRAAPKKMMLVCLNLYLRQYCSVLLNRSPLKKLLRTKRRFLPPVRASYCKLTVTARHQNKKKGKRKAAYGWEAFNQSSLEKAYKKRCCTSWAQLS